MNRSNTSPRAFSKDQLHAALGDVGGSAVPDYLSDIVGEAGQLRQRPAWTYVGSWLHVERAIPLQGVPRAAVLLALLSLLVASLVGGLVYVGSQSAEPRLGLPTTPDAWERVVIDPDAEGEILALATGPRGLLAAVGEGRESRLYVSTDGRDWTLVSPDQHGPVGYNGAQLVAMEDRFLLVGNEVLASVDGVTWRRFAGRETGPGQGTPIAAAVGGPGLVAVGSDNKAWYSTDGSDWSLADVPPPLGEPSKLARSLDPDQAQGVVEMLGVAVAGDDLVAWGTSIWVHDDGSKTFIPVLWASSDGMSWIDVPAPYPTRYAKVAGGPDGFIIEDDSDAWRNSDVWQSADGRSWERVAEDALGSSRWPGLENDDGLQVELNVGSVAAGAAGYVAAGTDGLCMLRCDSAEAVIWTSPDGRTWSRLLADDRFGAPNGAEARVAVPWGSRFVVGGDSNGRPTIWISDPEQP